MGNVDLFHRLRGGRWVEKMGTGTAHTDFKLGVPLAGSSRPHFFNPSPVPALAASSYSSSPSIRWVPFFIRLRTSFIVPEDIDP